MYMLLPPRVLDSVGFMVAFPVESATADPSDIGLLKLSAFPLHTPLVMEDVPGVLE